MAKSKAAKKRAAGKRPAPAKRTTPKKKRVRKRNRKGRTAGRNPLLRTARGRGAYTIGGALGGMLGNMGSAVSHAAGGFIGGGIDAIIDGIAGMGKYTVKANTLGSGRPPQFDTAIGSDGSLEFAHSEFLQDISTAGALFTLQSFKINPGLFTTFPFLSQLALRFEQYQMLGLVFEYRSTSADALNSTNTALGTVIMSTEYDVLDINFENKQQMDAYMFTSSGAPSQTMLHAVECMPGKNVLSAQYVRSSGYPTGSDPRFYDLGNFQIATIGQQAAAVIGELWVSYHVLLSKPKLPMPNGGNLLNYHAVELPTDTASAAHPFGTDITGNPSRFATGSNWPDTISVEDDVLRFNYIGTYLCSISWVRQTGTMTAAPSLTFTGTNLTLKNVFYDGTLNLMTTFDDADAMASMTFIVKVKLPGTGTANALTFLGPTGMSAGSVDIFVSEVTSAFTESALPTFDKRRANFLDDITDRLKRLEVVQKRLEDREREILSNSWGCAGDTEDIPLSTSSTSKGKVKAGTLLKVEEPKLSDSVVDLIASKLRK